MNENIKRMQEVYTQSSVILEKAQEDYSTSIVPDEYREFLSLRLMVSIIHNDVCREYYNFNANFHLATGLSRLLALGSVIMKLFEAHIWYSQIGNKQLRKLAKSRGMITFIDDKFKKMKRINPSRIEKYSGIRNDLSVHYSDKTINVIQHIGSISANDVFEDIEIVLLYGMEWMKALRSIGKLDESE